MERSMAARDAEVLRQARENFVRKRRQLAEQMVPPGAMAQHFAPTFTELQLAIESLDRAILDEENLPVSYASPQPEGETGATVVKVDFEAG
jgi:hypothetical protein